MNSICKFNKIIKETQAYHMLAKVFLILLTHIANLLVRCEEIGFGRRLMQGSLFNALPYSAFASYQIYKMLNFQNNDRLINSINADKRYTFQVAHNQFSYMSPTQIAAGYLTVNIDKTPIFIPKIVPKVTSETPNITLAQVSTNSILSQTIANKSIINIDWRNKNVVSAVKNQGSCGACWAFAAVAQLQSHFAMNSFLNLSLSQQQLIDCSTQYGNIGCEGGMMDNAFRYIIDYGITLNSNYPYQSRTGNSCLYSRTMPSYSIKQSKIIVKDCSSLVQSLQIRPVTVVVSVDINFLFYRSGVLNVCGKNINHALQLVGYYKDANSAYYIGKNSWGVSWGQQGFVHIDANLQNGNLCSVCEYPQYPL